MGQKTSFWWYKSVDDIIFRFKDSKLCEEFSHITSKDFQMSMMGELNFFLGPQINQSREGIFISQSKYALNLIHQEV